MIQACMLSRIKKKASRTTLSFKNQIQALNHRLMTSLWGRSISPRTTTTPTSHSTQGSSRSTQRTRHSSRTISWSAPLVDKINPRVQRDPWRIEPTWTWTPEVPQLINFSLLKRSRSTHPFLQMKLSMSRCSSIRCRWKQSLLRRRVVPVYTPQTSNLLFTQATRSHQLPRGAMTPELQWWQRSSCEKASQVNWKVRRKATEVWRRAQLLLGRVRQEP